MHPYLHQSSSHRLEIRRPTLTADLSSQSATPAETGLSQRRTSLVTCSETWTGFIRDHTDAQIVVEAVVAGQLQAVNNFPVLLSGVRIRCGTVLVFAERTAKVEKMRWRDGLNWSYSRISGPFLLYREVESVREEGREATGPPVIESSEFVLRSVRPNTRLVPGGLAKRTLTVQASCGTKYRVINYFYPRDVQHHYGDLNLPSDVRLPLLPSQDPALHRFSKSMVSSTLHMSAANETNLASSRDLTPPLLGTSPPSSPKFVTASRRQSEQSLVNTGRWTLASGTGVLISDRRPSTPNHNFMILDRRTSFGPSNSCRRASLQVPSSLNPPFVSTMAGSQMRHDHESFAKAYLFNRFQLESQKHGGSQMRRKSVEYFNGHPFWSDAPILKPLNLQSETRDGTLH